MDSRSLPKEAMPGMPVEKQTQTTWAIWRRAWGTSKNFVRDVSLSLGADGSVARDWLELGLMAAEGRRCQSAFCRAPAGHGATGRARKKARSARFESKRRFPRAGRSSVTRWLDGSSWTPLRLASLEVGLMKLADVTEPGMGKAWSTSAASEKPYWDAETGELRLGGQSPAPAGHGPPIEHPKGPRRFSGRGLATTDRRPDRPRTARWSTAADRAPSQSWTSGHPFPRPGNG